MTVGNNYCIFTCCVRSMLYGLPQFNPSNKLTESFFFFNFMPQIPSSIPCPTSTSITIHHHNQWDIVVKVSGHRWESVIRSQQWGSGLLLHPRCSFFSPAMSGEACRCVQHHSAVNAAVPHFSYLHSPLLSCEKLVHRSSTFNELLKEVTVWDSVFQMPKEIRKSFSGPSSLYN